jgi:hypothetical protein
MERVPRQSGNRCQRSRAEVYLYLQLHPERASDSNPTVGYALRGARLFYKLACKRLSISALRLHI